MKVKRLTLFIHLSLFILDSGAQTLSDCQRLASERMTEPCQACFQNLLKKDSLNLETLSAYGLFLFKINKDEPALTALEKCQSAKGLNQEAELAICLIRLRKSIDSTLVNKIKLHFQSTHQTPAAILAQTECLLLTGQYKKGTEMALNSIKSMPYEPRFYLLAGRFFQKQDQPAEAMFYFNRCLNIDPSCCEAYFRRAEIYLSRKSYSEVFSNLDKALSLNQGFDFELLRLYTLLYHALHAYDLCIIQGEKAMHFERGDTLFRYCLTDAYLFNNQIDKASKMIQNENQSSFNHQYFRIKLEQIKGNCKNLMPDIHKLQKAYSGNRNLLLLSAQCRTRNDYKSLQLSLNELNTLLEKDSLSWEALFLKAELLQCLHGIGKPGQDPCIPYFKAIKINESIRNRKTAIKCS